jgi:molybdenum cofactor biosynthesis enzyme MoaA
VSAPPTPGAEPTRSGALERRRPPLPTRLLRYGERAIDPRHTVRRAIRERQRPADASPGDAERRNELQLRWSACHAPTASLYFDQHGKVRACCQNTGHLLGDVTTTSLRAIWDGAAARDLRAALERDDLTLGCEFCAWQRDEVEPRSWFSGSFDVAPVGPRRTPRWPRQMEFSLSNACNLQCTMCNGEWSSSIRSQREGLPPLPTVYDDAFFEQLAEFLPHLEEAHLLGGEPFLGREPLRVLEMLASLPRVPRVSITTNATIATARVLRLVEHLRPAIVASIDGGDAETYEAIRVGASFDEVIANVDRFRSILGSPSVTIAHCLMVENWHRFPELLALAEARETTVTVNVVRFPEPSSLYHLPTDRLDEVVRELEQRTPWVEAHLTGPRLATWHDQLAALRARSATDAWPAALGVAPEVAVAPPTVRRDG